MRPGVYAVRPGVYGVRPGVYGAAPRSVWEAYSANSLRRRRRQLCAREAQTHAHTRSIHIIQILVDSIYNTHIPHYQSHVT